MLTLYGDINNFDSLFYFCIERIMICIVICCKSSVTVLPKNCDHINVLNKIIVVFVLDCVHSNLL